ncbi:MAG: hypothetical protein JW871_04235 [Endomicrobiales bacterium]|nr:hypothetical protein [Endomicrobiales bacterium]
MGHFEITHDKELDLVVYTAKGDINFGDLYDEIARYYEGPLTRYTMWDFTESKVHLSSDDVNRIADQVRKAGTARKGGLDAIIVSDVLKYALARMYGAYMEIVGKDADILKTEIFYRKKNAMAHIKRHAFLNKFEKDER